MDRHKSTERLRTLISRHGNPPKIQRIKSNMLRHLATLYNFALWYVIHPGYFFRPELYYTYIDFVITTNCTLKCKNCSHFMPRYAKTPYPPADLLIEDAKKLLNSIRWVDGIRVMGGEPLLHPQLSEIVEFLLKSPKIGFVEIVTNGTLSPKNDLLNLFPNKKLNITVSNYGKLSVKLDEFASNEKINKIITTEDLVWYYHGNLSCRNKSAAELAVQYSKCNRDKCVLYDGKIYSCGCSAFGFDLKAFNLCGNEFVDLRNSAGPEQIKKHLCEFRHRKYFTACNYCTWGTESFVPVRVAEQIETTDK